MRREKIVDHILKLEEKYSTVDWSVNGIQVWPIVRFELFFSLHRNQQQKIKKDSLIKRFAYLFRNLIYTLKFYFYGYKQANVIFVGADSHRVSLHNLSFNRYFDPLLDHLENNLNERSYLVEYRGSINHNPIYHKNKRVIEIFRVFYIVKLLDKLLPRRASVKDVHLPSYEDFIKEAASLGFVTGSLSLDKIIERVNTIKLYKKVFSFLISKINPKYCFQLCYYNNEMFGLNLAVHSLNKLSIDVQHGTQGPLHIGYTEWLLKHNENYELLPDIFWCWDKESYLNIHKWTSKSLKHSAIVGGNPWLDFMSNSKLEFESLPSNILLFTLQPTGEILDQYIIDSIKATPPNFKWYLRLHPRQMNQKQELITILESSNILNIVNIDQATQLPLPVLLKNTVVHITKFSGSALEAASLGVPSIILDEIGAISFKELLDSNAAYLVLDKKSESVINCIEFICTKRNISHKTLLNQSLDTFDRIYKQ